jgi:hypothetical protein
VGAAVNDVLYVVLTLVVFAAVWLLIKACDR